MLPKENGRVSCKTLVISMARKCHDTMIMDACIRPNGDGCHSDTIVCVNKSSKTNLNKFEKIGKEFCYKSGGVSGNLRWTIYVILVIN